RADGGEVDGGVGRSVVPVPGNLIAAEGGGQDVGVAVAVHVRCRHRLGPEGGGADGAQGEGGDRRAVVLVPGDLVIGERGGQHVGVAIPVHVRRRHRLGPVGGGADGVQREGRDGGAVILVPGDLVVVVGSGQHVGVAVAVHVRRTHRACSGGTGGDGAQGEAGRSGPVVLVPGNLVVAERGGQDVEVAVAIQIRRRHRDGSGGAGGD